MKRFVGFLVAATLLFSGAAFGQSGAGNGPPVGLKGFDPVSYFDPGKPAQGAPDISYDFDNTRYHFVSQKHRVAFASDPERYSPQFGGLCAAGLSSGVKAVADPRVFRIVDGKLYVFSSTAARDNSSKDPTLLKRAREVWDQEHR